MHMMTGLRYHPRPFFSLQSTFIIAQVVDRCLTPDLVTGLSSSNAKVPSKYSPSFQNQPPNSSHWRRAWWSAESKGEVEQRAKQRPRFSPQERSIFGDIWKYWCWIFFHLDEYWGSWESVITVKECHLELGWLLLVRYFKYIFENGKFWAFWGVSGGVS